MDLFSFDRLECLLTLLSVSSERALQLGVLVMLTLRLAKYAAPSLVLLAVNGCGLLPNQAVHSIPVLVEFVPSEARNIGTASLFLRFSDTALDISTYDKQCRMNYVADRFTCSLDVPPNVGTKDHRIWVMWSESPRSFVGGTSTATASNVYVNKVQVRILPSPVHQFGFFRVDSTGQVQ